jgi:hypothetical protein
VKGPKSAAVLHARGHRLHCTGVTKAGGRSARCVWCAPCRLAPGPQSHLLLLPRSLAGRRLRLRFKALGQNRQPPCDDPPYSEQRRRGGNMTRTRKWHTPRRVAHACDAQRRCYHGDSRSSAPSFRSAARWAPWPRDSLCGRTRVVVSIGASIRVVEVSAASHGGRACAYRIHQGATPDSYFCRARAVITRA